MNRKDIAFLFATMAAIVVIVIVAIVIAYNAPRVPPVSGYISAKNIHPEYYPAFPDTPYVNVLVITGKDGRHHYTWVVDDETYDLYRVGDNVTKWVRKEPPEVTDE